MSSTYLQDDSIETFKQIHYSLEWLLTSRRYNSIWDKKRMVVDCYKIWNRLSKESYKLSEGNKKVGTSQLPSYI